jgi:hypothetical protein
LQDYQQQRALVAASVIRFRQISQGAHAKSAKQKNP